MCITKVDYPFTFRSVGMQGLGSTKQKHICLTFWKLMLYISLLFNQQVSFKFLDFIFNIMCLLPTNNLHMSQFLAIVVGFLLPFLSWSMIILLILNILVDAILVFIWRELLISFSIVLPTSPLSKLTDFLISSFPSSRNFSYSLIRKT